MKQTTSLHQHENYARAVRRLGSYSHWYNTECGPVLGVERRKLGLTFLWAVGLPQGVNLPPANVTIFNMCHSVSRPAWTIRVAKGVETALWDIRPDIIQLRSGLLQKWRNRLARAERSGLEIIADELPADPNHWLLTKAQEHGRISGYRGWPPAMTAAYAADPKASLLVQTADKSAAMLFLRHGIGATYHIGWRAIDAPVGVHNLILWQAIMMLKVEGIQTIDLGTLPKSNKGLCHFKLGTGAHVQPTGDTFLKLRIGQEKSRRSGGFSKKVSGLIQPP